MDTERQIDQHWGGALLYKKTWRRKEYREKKHKTEKTWRMKTLGADSKWGKGWRRARELIIVSHLNNKTQPSSQGFEVSYPSSWVHYCLVVIKGAAFKLPIVVKISLHFSSWNLLYSDLWFRLIKFWYFFANAEATYPIYTYSSVSRPVSSRDLVTGNLPYGWIKSLWIVYSRAGLPCL